jgi:hypothetical protein
VLVLCAVATACQPVQRPPEDATVSVPPPTVAAAAVPATARRSLVNELADNRRELVFLLEDQGWVVNRTIEIEAGPAVVVVSEPSRGQAAGTMTSRVDVVGPGPFRELFKETSLVDVIRTPDDDAPVWNLRGDGGAQVILSLTPCGANCGLPEQWAVELTDAGPHEMFPVPECPSCTVDETVAGVPVLAEYIELTIASCARVSCGPTYALSVRVPKLVMWDGEAFSSSAAPLRRVYEARNHEQGRVTSTAACPLEQLQGAAELYFQTRVLGTDAAEARRGVNQEYPPQSTIPCQKTHSLLSTPRSWDQLLDELEQSGIPVLE